MMLQIKLNGLLHSDDCCAFKVRYPSGPFHFSLNELYFAFPNGAGYTLLAMLLFHLFLFMVIAHSGNR